ncbi:MAG: flagellar FlbD family protein [Dehalococcoidales bacterium]|nr:flagellar FlbD family protein [Dehalococcoidales bacterium]
MAGTMIRVTRMDGTTLFLNSDLIESVEATPDTVVRLTTQKRIIVRESPRRVVSLIIGYRRALAWKGRRARRQARVRRC